MTEKEALEAIRITTYPFELFDMLPSTLWSEEVIKAAVQRAPACLRLLPPESLTLPVIRAARWELPEHISYIPPEYLTEGICMAILQKNPFMLPYLPEEKHTPEMLTMIVNKEYDLKESRVLSFFPYLKDPDLLLQAIKRIGCGYNHTFVDTLTVIPAHRLNEEMVEHILSRFPEAIEKIPAPFSSLPAYTNVLKKEGRLLKKVPERLRTRELCEVAFAQDPCAIQFIPKEHADHLPLAEAIRQVPLTLSFVPEALKTEELQKEIAKTGDLYFARHLTDPEAAIELFRNYDGKCIRPQVIDKFKEEVVTPGFAHAFIERFPLGYEELINRYPVFKEDRQLAEKAVETHPRNLFFISEPFKNDLLCLEAGDRDFSVIKAFPRRLFTPETCQEIVRLDQEGHSPGWIPEECMTRELCQLIAEKALTQYKEKASCFGFIPYPDIILSAIKKAGPIVAEYIYFHTRPELRTEEMTAQVMEIAKEHLKISPLYFTRFPPSVKTPEVCLFAIKKGKYPELLKQFVPPSVTHGENVYSFSQKLPRDLYETMNVEEIGEAYRQQTASPLKQETPSRQSKLKL